MMKMMHPTRDNIQNIQGMPASYNSIAEIPSKKWTNELNRHFCKAHVERQLGNGNKLSFITHQINAKREKPRYSK